MQNFKYFAAEFGKGGGGLVTERLTSVCLKEGNVLFNDALNTFYLRLYGVRHG